MRFMTVVVRVFDRDDRHSVDGYLRLNLAGARLGATFQNSGKNEDVRRNL